MDNKLLLHSPVTDQDFIWIASYMDGTYLSEISYDTKITNPFDSVNRNSLIRFGLVGQGMNLYFEVYGGEYKLAGRVVEILYKDKKTNKEYNLTGHGLLPYNNIHQHKNGETSFNSLDNSGYGSGVITQYNFGYTKNLLIDDVNFTLKTTCCIPYGRLIYINIELTADRDFEDGLIVFRKNGIENIELDAPLESGQTCSGDWTVT